MILQDIKETKRYRHTHGRTVSRTDNVKTVYTPPPKKKRVSVGYNEGEGSAFCDTVSESLENNKRTDKVCI